MDEATLVEIDSPTDWEIVEKLIAARAEPTVYQAA